MALPRYVRLLLLCVLSLCVAPAALAGEDDDDDWGGGDSECRISRSSDCDDDHGKDDDKKNGKDKDTDRDHDKGKDKDDDCDDDDCDDAHDRRWCGALHGAAFGLCNAFCNAQECHLRWKHSCEQLRRNFEKHTGESQFPCEVDRPTATPEDTATFTPTHTPPDDDEATPTVTPDLVFPTATATFAGTVAAETPTPLLGEAGTCECDCNGDGIVTVHDLTRSVLIVLAIVPAGDCHALSGRPSFTIGDLVRGVRHALDGC